MTRLVLASASPRRQALLLAAGLSFEVRPSSLVEELSDDEAPVALARRLALEKAALVHRDADVTLGADTVVHLAGRAFGKPQDDAEARAWLAALSGVWHEVTTGFAVLGSAGASRRQQLRVGHATTKVRFRSLTSADIERYVTTGEGRDKAGAYAIQGVGGALVDRLVGSYTNVVGIPLSSVLRALKSAGVEPDGDRRQP